MDDRTHRAQAFLAHIQAASFFPTHYLEYLNQHHLLKRLYLQIQIDQTAQSLQLAWLHQQHLALLNKPSSIPDEYDQVSQKLQPLSVTQQFSCYIHGHQPWLETHQNLHTCP